MKYPPWSKLGAFKESILDFIFPVFCLGCGERKTSLCVSCINKLERPIGNMPGWIHPLFSYKDQVARSAIWHLKYKNTRGLGKIFGNLLHEYIMEFFSDNHAVNKNLQVAIVPIPLTRGRENARGYNQSKIIAEAITKNDFENVFSLDYKSLARKESNSRQSHTRSKRERMRNIIDCFFVKSPDKVRGKIIILIDDVVTTGATLREARKVLLSAGAKKVIAFTIAH